MWEKVIYQKYILPPSSIAKISKLYIIVPKWPIAKVNRNFPIKEEAHHICWPQSQKPVEVELGNNYTKN
jgi:hypothetical protein